MLTKREIFEKVKGHLLTQKAVSRKSRSASSPVYGCAYRGEAGMKCAVGCLISDADYSLDFEGAAPVAATDLNRFVPEDRVYRINQALMNAGVDMNDRKTAEMVRELQFLHDNKPVHEWATELQLIESNYKC